MFLRITNVFAVFAVFHYTNHAFDSTSTQRQTTVKLRDERKLDLSTFFQSECQCMRLKDCTSMMTILEGVRPPLPDWLSKSILNTSCGYARKEHLVCCPKEGLKIMKPVREEWVWDAEDHNSLPDDSSELKPRFNDYYDSSEFDGSNNHLIDFEDPHTHKNCPPSFYDDYRGYHYHNHKHNSNHNHHHDGWFHHRGNNNNNNDKEFRFPSRKPPPMKPTEAAVNTPRPLVNSPQCGVSLNTRIIGGQDSGVGQFPWVVRVAYINISSQLTSYRCAGSAINARYIVTAAHCVTNLVDDLRVSHIRHGDRRSATEDESRDYDIERTIVHEDYDKPKYANDIALIRLTRPLNGGKVTPICLPLNGFRFSDDDLVGKFGIVAGWSTRAVGSPTLQFVRLPIVNQTSCASIYAQFSANTVDPIIITASQLCAQGRENMDACQGDSGGPLMDDGTDTTNRFSLLGLVSFGPRTCGLSDFPGVYTRMQSFTDWVLSNVS